MPDRDALKACDSCGKSRPLRKFRLHDQGDEPWSRGVSLCATCAAPVVRLMELPRTDATPGLYQVKDPRTLLPSQTLIDQGAVKPPRRRRAP